MTKWRSQGREAKYGGSQKREAVFFPYTGSNSSCNESSFRFHHFPALGSIIYDSDRTALPVPKGTDELKIVLPTSLC